MARGYKTGGRQKGTPNRVTSEFRGIVQDLIDENADNVSRWLTLVADGDGESLKPDPARALDLVSKLAEYAAPKLSRTEVTGEDGGPVQSSLTISFVGSPNP